MSERLAARGLAVLALSLLAVHSAEATSIRLFDKATNTTVTIDDGQVGLDKNAAADVVTFDGTIGAWKLNITTGVTLSSDPNDPFLQLASLNATNSAGGELTVWLTETGFGPTGSLVDAGLFGTALGTITYQTYQGLTPFDEGVLLTSQSFNSGSFSGTETGALANATGPYSLTQKITIVHTAKGMTDFYGTLDVSGTVVSVPDSGSTVSLLGLALLAVGVLRRIASL